jgi:hypothetical protein
MNRRRLAYLAIALTSFGFAACSANPVGPELQPEFQADSALTIAPCFKQGVGGSVTKC